MLNRLIHIALVSLCPLLASAQQYYLKGQVRDEAGIPLQNVSILVNSSGYLFYTGNEGAFGVVINQKVDTVTFSFSGFEKQTLALSADKFVNINLKKAPVTRSGSKLSSLTRDLKREVQQQWFTGDETYASLVENQFITTSSYPATGVTLNVDRASYSNVRRFIKSGTTVPPDAVRLEEMLNYFNFDYYEPPPGRTFAIKTTLTECPWNKENQVLFAQVVSKKLSYDSLPPTHLVFLIDISGSMDMPNRLPLLKNGFKALIKNLRAKDSVSIVVYGGTVGIALPTTGGDEKAKMFRVIDSLQTGGSTPGESGVKLAYSVARNHFIKKGNNRIILATDGDFNVGMRSEEELEELVSREKNAGIYLTCLGIGMGNYKDSKIQTLAQWGNGNFSYLDSYAEAEKVLLKEFAQTLYTVADDAYLNVRFNPEFVKEYRLLGFDNKAGALRDTQSMIEGGEIGSAYSSFIAFELMPAKPLTRDSLLSLADFNLRYKDPGGKTLHIITESPKVALTPFVSVSKEYRLATSVILFGSLLRQSRFVKEGSWTELGKLAAEAVDPANYSQQEFLQLLQQAKSIYSKHRIKIWQSR